MIPAGCSQSSLDDLYNYQLQLLAIAIHYTYK